MKKYDFRPYNAIFPELFDKEKNRLSKYLTGAYQIEHIGSTAVPGLGGKGIIDIYIVVLKEDINKISREVLSSGYAIRPRISFDQHIFYRIDLPDMSKEIRRYHVHISYPEAEDFKQAIVFRDYLRKHPVDAEKYAFAKIKAANEADQDKVKYMTIKTPVIEEILKKAVLL